MTDTTAPLLRVAIDGNEGNVPNRVGSNTYAFELIRELEQLTRSDRRFQFDILHTEQLLPDWPAEREGWNYIQVPGKKFATQWAYPLYLYRHRKNYDLMYVPGHYAPRLCPVPYLCTVMDLAFLRYPRQFKTKDYLQLKYWTKYSVKKAQHVTAISEFTKQEVGKFYHIPFHQITVIPPGFRFERQDRKQSSSIIQEFGIRDPYILYVGTIQPRKNLIRLIEAFERASVTVPSQSPRKRRKNQSNFSYERLNLVIAGKTGWLSESTLKRIDESKLRDRIKLLGFVNDQQKAALYANASCVALVGLYEGFGIPALEALAYRKIPVVSNSSSLPEVVGKSGILVDPLDSGSIARGLVQALTATQHVRRQQIHVAREQLMKYTWHQSAETLRNTLLNVAQSVKK